jgi:16S rRNA (guanine527-N7)-methyltransferase
VESHAFRLRLLRQTLSAGITLSPESLDGLEAYFLLLSKWNVSINLTGLPLTTPTDETFERLFVEPLCAASSFPENDAAWFDLGTGGGSPAIPLKIARPSLRLTMVESKARKAAFLREVLRVLKLPGASVEEGRFEVVAHRFPGIARFITVRAVRIDKALIEASEMLLSIGGELLLFRRGSAELKIPGFSHRDTHPLGVSREVYLSSYSRMFHVEQSR